jgi:hypothetical protein
MEIYYALALGSIILNFIIKSNKFLTIILLLLATLIAFFRINVGTDYESYVDIIKNIDNQTGDRGIEFTFTALVQLLKYFNIHNLEIITISSYALLSGILILLIVNKIKYHPNFIYTYIFFSPLYLQSLNLIRLFVAVQIIWYALLIRPSFYLYIFLVILAASFHYSALVLIILYPFLFDDIGIKWKLLSIPIIIAIKLFFSNIIPEYYSFYVVSDEIIYNYNFLFILLFGWIYTEIHLLKNQYLYIRNLAFLAFISPIVGISINMQPELIYRYSLYFSVYIPLIMTDITVDGPMERGVKNVTCRFILPIAFLISLNQTGIFYKMVPYKSFL